jgi:hypothetical protein
MHRVLFIIAVLAFPSTLLAQTVRVDVRYVEIDVTEHAEATDSFLAEQKTILKRATAKNLFESSAKFVETLGERKAAMTREVATTLTLDENLSGSSHRATSSGTEKLELNSSSRGRTKDIAEIRVECKCDLGRGKFSRSTSLDFRREDFKGTYYYPLGTDTDGKGRNPTRHAMFFVVDFSQTSPK